MMPETSFLEEPSTSRSMLARAQNGDTESWQQLAQVYGPIIYAWARRSGCQAADAADVMQETLSAVASALQRFDHQRDGATFRGWLWTITRNKIRDHLRLLQHEEAAGGTAANLAMRQVPEAEPLSEPPTDAASDAQAARTRMLELLRTRFDHRTWTMFWETTIIGRDVHDVADQMGVSKWAVYKSRARVLQRLKDELHGMDDF
ncbi:sigma-70 family RNA polymerase sigma factor [Roseiconus lacunae]|uniref:RNA polymerase sigma factor n=1 Tax=Roseiconus lacunae TaxID=2605694 RepID=UPI001E572324|nr:sigma-70 family RNA polymerase sigma factor [Roseiconus lacunae]MCD0459243.1 sigma-70 family RNA polymerase sigma factor [Roseiconus lacunae]WRQ53670.1 sigma-70 family RNA polymerase sigma factor [Stieleria sp. HD01]